MRKTLLALGLLALPIAATAQTKVAATPAMGWNSWNHFATRVVFTLNLKRPGKPLRRTVRKW